MHAEEARKRAELASGRYRDVRRLEFFFADEQGQHVLAYVRSGDRFVKAPPPGSS